MINAPSQRIVLDVTSLVRWAGPPVGIIRVVHALAMALRAGSPGQLVAYDTTHGQYRTLDPRWLDTLLGWSGLVDRHMRQTFPNRIVSRSGSVMALERIRLTTDSPWLARLADRLQRIILAPRAHQFPLEDRAGCRIANVPVDLAFGAVMRFQPDDTLLLPGMGWSYLDAERLVAIKAESGCRIAGICYDLIPITHPQFYSKQDQEAFETYWRAMLPVLDQWLFSAQAIQSDLTRWCDRMSVVPPSSAIVDFGYDPPPLDEIAPLPASLRSGKFALFVSTIEPRKGHATMLTAWERLLARRLPQQHDFRLVFVGRPGWMVDDVLRRLKTPPWGVVYLSGCADRELGALYRHAAFCCYPSQYEGYGLPLIEAFARGKAVMSSSGGALPETAEPFAPCLNPLDIDAWTATLGDWIEHPELVAAREREIAEHFRHPDWPEAAASIFGVLSQPALAF
jgi:glycosyltransferase involved in cell wall biosynthesis